MKERLSNDLKEAVLRKINSKCKGSEVRTNLAWCGNGTKSNISRKLRLARDEVIKESTQVYRVYRS